MTHSAPDKHRATVIQPDDYGTTGQAALKRERYLANTEGRALSTIRGEVILAVRYKDECKLDVLNSRGYVTDRQWRAGWLFRREWLMGHIQPAVCGAYREPTGRSSGLHVSEARAEARRASAASQGAVTAKCWDVVVSVCGLDENAGGKTRLLCEGLDDLAKHYDVPGDYCRPAHKRVERRV